MKTWVKATGAAIVAGSLISLGGCSSWNALFDTAIDAGTVSAQHAADELADAAKKVQCAPPVGGIARKYSVRELIYTLDTCGVDIAALRDELNRFTPAPEPAHALDR